MEVQNMEKKSKDSKLQAELRFQLKALGLPDPEEEFHFAKPHRQWRADMAYPHICLIIEIQGGRWMEEGAHNTGKGLARDYEKANAAQALGWRYLQFHEGDIKSGWAAELISRWLYDRNDDFEPWWDKKAHLEKVTSGKVHTEDDSSN